MTRKLVLSVCSAFALFAFVGFAAQEEPKYTIKQVMKEANKGGLLKKVVSGQASAEEKEHLLELYKEMALNTEPKGSHDEWEKRTQAIVEAAQGVVDGKEGAAEALLKANNCKACHSVHRP
ncbi:hypothetical protein [Tautonia sociabilis]|uniref:Cytochrome c n=1 Tax=Tautonia sociabilis TaxID=2080755 RepID=A0A432ML05_9BACT|nr:hypothetical protein [Tautonia sociabilis]RUL87816.1 hypothetical protein TsocGM_10685 [Tautonia sociabilis]